MLLLLFLAISLGRLIRAGQSKGCVIGQLCFFSFKLLDAGFFGNNSLDLHFGNKNGVRIAVTFAITDILVSDHDVKF